MPDNIVDFPTKIVNVIMRILTVDGPGSVVTIAMNREDIKDVKIGDDASFTHQGVEFNAKVLGFRPVWGDS